MRTGTVKPRLMGGLKAKGACFPNRERELPVSITAARWALLSCSSWRAKEKERVFLGSSELFLFHFFLRLGGKKPRRVSDIRFL